MKFTASLKKNFEFKRVYAKGKSHAAPSVVVYCRKNNGSMNRLGITVGSKVGNAVVRNRVRRRLKEIYRLNESCVRPGYDIILVARLRSVEAPYLRLQSEILKSFRALGILEETASV